MLLSPSYFIYLFIKEILICKDNICLRCIFYWQKCKHLLLHNLEYSLYKLRHIQPPMGLLVGMVIAYPLIYNMFNKYLFLNNDSEMSLYMVGYPISCTRLSHQHNLFKPYISAMWHLQVHCMTLLSLPTLVLFYTAIFLCGHKSYPVLAKNTSFKRHVNFDLHLS